MSPSRQAAKGFANTYINSKLPIRLVYFIYSAPYEAKGRGRQQCLYDSCLPFNGVFILSDLLLKVTFRGQAVVGRDGRSSATRGWIGQRPPTNTNVLRPILLILYHSHTALYGSVCECECSV